MSCDPWKPGDHAYRAPPAPIRISRREDLGILGLVVYFVVTCKDCGRSARARLYRHSIFGNVVQIKDE